MKDLIVSFKKVFNSWYMFIPRLVIWIGCTFVCPIVFILQKFQVFEKVEGVEKIKFNGWFIVIGLIVAIGVFYVLKYVLSAMTYNYISQLLSGFIHLILWLILIRLGIDLIVKFQEQFKYILNMSIITCSIGVAINPLPRWSYNRKNKDIANALAMNLNK